MGLHLVANQKTRDRSPLPAPVFSDLNDFCLLCVHTSMNKETSDEIDFKLTKIIWDVIVDEIFKTIYDEREFLSTQSEKSG